MAKYNQQFDGITEKLLSSAVHFAEDSILITDKNLKRPGPKIIYVNPAFTRMSGYKAEEVIGKNPRFLQGPRTDKQVLKRLRETLQRGEVFYGQAINYRKDGKEFWSEWHIEPIRDEKGKITHFMAIQHDVTGRVEAQHTLEQKNMALKEILQQIELEKNKIRQDVRANVDKVLLPAIKKLYRKGSPLDKKHIKVLEKSLMELTSSFGVTLSEKKIKLSPREMEIANLIKGGLSSKEICEILNISFKTIETYRNKIRQKLGLVNKNVNLMTCLQDL